MAEAQMFGAQGETRQAPQQVTTGVPADQPATAPYPPEALARLRAALRAGLLPATPVSPDREAAPGDGPNGAALPAVISDALPEYTVYRDAGCHIAPACLSCPLERCIFDRPAHADSLLRRGRNRRMRALAGRGWEIARLARDFRLSPAQVRRILRSDRLRNSRHAADPGSR